MNQEVHSTIEAISAFITLSMAWFLYLKRKESNGGKYAMLAIGFLAMGIILLFIATTTPGKGFILLHHTKDLIMSFFFALIWIPTIQEYIANKRWIPWFVIAFIFIIGLLEIFARDLFPQIVVGNTYTNFAVTIDYLSSALFIIAGLYFAREYYRLKKTEDLLFGLIIIMFILHSFTAHEVQIWTLAWWSWHAIQMAGILIILTYVIWDYLHTKESLLISEKKYQQLFDHAPDGIIQIDSKANIIDCNQGECKLLGYERNEIIGKHITEFLSEDSKEISKKGFSILQNDGHFETELSLVRKDGKIFPSWQTVNAVYDDNGKITSAIAHTHDITERKKAEKNLKSSEERLKILFESAPDAYYLSNLKGTFLDGNKSAEDLLGYKKEEIIGKSFLKLKLLSVKELLKASKLLLKNLQGKGTGPDEFILNRKDGSQVPVEISTYPVKIKDKTVVLGIARDITERKQMEDELKKHRDHLEEMVKEGTANLKDKNKELEEKNIELERYNRLFENREFRIKELRDQVKELKKNSIVDICGMK